MTPLLLALLLAQPSASDPPRVAAGDLLSEDLDSVRVYRVELTAEGVTTWAVALADKTCPTQTCNGTMRIRTTGNYPQDDTYPALIGTRSTGQLTIDLVPVPGSFTLGLNPEAPGWPDGLLSPPLTSTN